MKKFSDNFIEKVRNFQNSDIGPEASNLENPKSRNNSGTSSTSSGFTEPKEFSNYLYSLSDMHNNDKEKIYPNKSSENQPQQVTENGDSSSNDHNIEKDLTRNFNNFSVSDRNLKYLSFQDLKQKATAYKDKVKSYNVRYIDVKSYSHCSSDSDERQTVSKKMTVKFQT